MEKEEYSGGFDVYMSDIDCMCQYVSRFMLEMWASRKRRKCLYEHDVLPSYCLI